MLCIFIYKTKMTKTWDGRKSIALCTTNKRFFEESFAPPFGIHNGITSRIQRNGTENRFDA